jgi:penicillin amidase
MLMLTTPDPWTVEDSILAVYAMYFTLQDAVGEGESTRGLMADVLSPEVYAFLNPPGTTWDAAVDGSTLDLPEMPASPGFDHAVSDDAPVPHRAQEDEAVPGSNNWAVAGSLTRYGSAMVANDMHLSVAVPNIWYRASIEYMYDERPITVTGLSFPGTPVMSAGSNGLVAWGFTNSYGDWYDLVELEQPTDEDHYLTPNGEVAIETINETIYLRGGNSVPFEIRETMWGPIVDSDHRGTQRAYRWVAHSVRAINLNLLKMEWTQNIDEGLSVAKRIGMPAQNIVMGDTQGNIAWTIAGAIPNRVGFDGRTPTSWADGTRGWDGWVAPEDYPQVVNPESQRLWTANSRVVGNDMLDVLGDGDYSLGARAMQIRDNLLALDQATEKDLLAIQLDNRALFLERWQELLVKTLSSSAAADTPARQAFLELIRDWDAHASADSVGYTLVRSFRLHVRDTLFASVLAPLSKHDENFRYLDAHRQMEGPLWELVTREPKGWLPKDHASWNEFLLACVDETAAQLTEDDTELSMQTWGKHNAPTLSHPLSRMVPALGRWLDMPNMALPGDSHMPRVQSGKLGSSERMVVSPGHEENGILHMPSSQTGHIWAPYFGKGHLDWVEGKATPFLPGPTEYRLILSPIKS